MDANLSNELEKSVSNNEIKEKSEETVVSKIYSLLKNYDNESAVKLVKSGVYDEYLKNNSLEIVPIIAEFLFEDFADPEIEKSVDEILIYIAHIANSKEALLVFLEAIETSKSTNHFKIILKCVQLILLKKVGSNVSSKPFEWVFKTINRYFEGLLIPPDMIAEKDESNYLKVDLSKICEALNSVLNFYSAFCEKVKSKELIWLCENGFTSYQYLSIFLLQLLHKPLCYLDLSQSDSIKREEFSACSDLVSMISQLVPNPFYFFRFVMARHNSKTISNNEDTETDYFPSVSQLAVATYFYCILSLELQDDIPLVYSNEFIFLSLVPCCLYLLEEKSLHVIAKGIVLLKSILDRINENSFTKHTLEVIDHSKLLNGIADILVYYESKDTRLIALHCLKRWIWVFDHVARYQVFINIFTSIPHAGIQGVVIYELKETLNGILKGKIYDNYFSGQKLKKLFQIAFDLPCGENCDVLDLSDKIMGGLNLLIFICVSDSKDVLDYKLALHEIDSTFLKPLGKALRLSKEYYSLQLKCIGEKSTEQSILDVELNGSLLSGLSPEQEKCSVMQTLNWIDTMNCVWSRAENFVANALMHN